jgi:hypothetical protein
MGAAPRHQPKPGFDAANTLLLPRYALFPTRDWLCRVDERLRDAPVGARRLGLRRVCKISSAPEAAIRRGYSPR